MSEYREHDLSGYDCWCGTRVEMVCPECEDDVEGKVGCWRCSGEGWVECDEPEMYDGPTGLLIIHRDTEPERTGMQEWCGHG
jgi:hypothetical protein